MATYHGLIQLAACLLLLGCDQITPNNPYPQSEATENIYYGSFSERPKYLDPARSYSSDESVFTGQIYEPPLQYAYIPGVYKLIPATAAQMPIIHYLNAEGKPIDGEKYPKQVAETVYEIKIKPGILYQPHPAFAPAIDEKMLKKIKHINDFAVHGTRELVAEDYVYEIKRLAWPRLNSPIYELMSDKIIGLKELHDALEKSDAKPLDLKNARLKGVKSLDKYTYQIRIKGVYPQFSYWLALQFFAPIPWEADVFYENKTLIDKNIVLDWYPVGTGAYMIQENNPNKQIVLVQNPNFRDEFYNNEKIPQIEKAVYSLENESIPAWNKFLQGYYDVSGVSSDNFATAIQTVAGQSEITPSLQAKGITLIKEVELASYYWGFGMHDEIVGGFSDKARKIRQAIGIAMDTEEYISIFLNERGLPAQFILPPGIFGYSSNINPFMYQAHQGKIERKSIQDAKKLLAEAGYPNGRDAKTNEPLIIHFDTSSSGGAQNQARDNWTRKQFKKIGIDLDIRTTDYNRFREKLNNGTAQFFFFGWSADYPDPENFLFLLYGPNGKVHHNGVNSTNYDNPAFNRLYEKMVLLPDNHERLDLIAQMREIAERDAPMVWGFNPESYLLKHSWLTQVIPNQMMRNGLKYYKIDGIARAKARQAWNKPHLWPLGACLLFIILVIIPLWLGYRKKENMSKAKRFE